VSLPAALPWHVDQWRTIASALDAGRLHHALLLEGPPGLGKQRFAERAAAALLCEAAGPSAQRPCERCRSCVLVAAGTHPDRLELSPEEDRRQIDVAQVRQRIGELALTAHYAARRVIVVSPADALNRHAANTLLKTLEEPPAGVVFLLVSARPASLPATVRSRCMRLRFAVPEREASQRWLRGLGDEGGVAATLLDWCGGAPIKALEVVAGDGAQRFDTMLEELSAIVSGELDPVAAAARWRAVGLRQTLEWQLRAAAQVLRLKAGGRPNRAPVAMQVLGTGLDWRSLDRVCEELYELRSALERQLNPAEQLALEALAVCWRDAAVSD
jgi:DNA polymerase-3 subunit delta'